MTNKTNTFFFLKKKEFTIQNHISHLKKENEKYIYLFFYIMLTTLIPVSRGGVKGGGVIWRETRELKPGKYNMYTNIYIV